MAKKKIKNPDIRENIVMESIVTGQGDQAAGACGKRIKNLNSSTSPNLKTHAKIKVPIFRPVVHLGRKERQNLDT